jgi:hypothetical protein
MTNKLFVLGVTTVAFAGTTLLNVQSSKADVVSTLGATQTISTPKASVASSTSVAVAVGKNPVAGSASFAEAGKGGAAAGTISGAATKNVGIIGGSYSATEAGKKGPSGAVAAAGALGKGSGVVFGFTNTEAGKGYATSTGAYGGTLVNYGHKKY